ncbi:PRAME family member 12-like [Orcinus orca]|uniref:PRAME family member 12-like n=1 Tax=Orcinus orca TaxID=9733 RepID=UPI0021136E4C|nr:PRAME family member 12-like [Orcinus orca]
MPHVGPLQAELETLDALFAQKLCPRKCKLQVQDLQDTGQNFWSMWSGAILPALSHCSQLRSFSLCGNLLSMAVMEKMLLHTTGLPCLSQEFYPVPQDNDSPQGVLLKGRLAQLGAELFEILRDLSQPKTICLSLSPCPHYDDDICNPMVPIIYCCNTHV